jgi:enoyl-CoA hydratase/carnithine racemase
VTIDPHDVNDVGLVYEKRDHLAFITLNRPERGNATIPEMVPVFKAIWEDVRDDENVRCAIVTGTGERHFCTGADVGAVATTGKVAAGDGPLHQEVFWTARRNRVWKPTVCAVNGTCASGGLHFVVDADVVVASRNASFLDTHVNVGMVGAIENIGLAQRLPLGTALRMTLQGRDFRLSAQRAYELGLVDELVEQSELMPTAVSIAESIARNSPRAVQLSQEAVWGSVQHGYDAALAYGWRLIQMQWAHPDFVEGPRAFAERREPDWTP